MMGLKGYFRNNEIGFRNHILIIPTVFCANKVCEDISDQVPEAIYINHAQGCGQIGSDLEQTKRTFIGTALNPNVYGVIIVGLGCEDAGAEEVAQKIKQKTEKPVHVFSIQDIGDTLSATNYGINIARTMIEEAKKLTQTDLNISNLNIGIIFNNNDEKNRKKSSAILKNVSEKFLASGSTIIIGDATTLNNKNLDYNSHLKSELYKIKKKYLTDSEFHSNVLMETDSFPLNKPISKISSYSESINHNKNGLYFMESSLQNLEQITGLISAGAHLIIVATSEPLILGSPTSPVITLCSDSEIFDNFKDDLDLGTHNSLTEEELFQKVISILCGTKTKGELASINDYGIQRIGPSI